MLQLSEIKKIEAFSHADTVEQYRADLDAIEGQLVEMGAPVRELEDEISKIQGAIARGQGLSVSDPAEFASQGGDSLLKELQSILSSKVSYLDILRADTQNLQEPLQMDMTDKEALDAAVALLHLFDVIYRPIPKEWSDEYETQNKNHGTA